MRNTICIVLLLAFLLVVRFMITGISEDYGTGFVTGIFFMAGLFFLAEKIGLSRPRY